MNVILWCVAIYLFVGIIIYFAILSVVEEQYPQHKFSQENNVKLVGLALIWLPLLIYCIFNQDSD